MFTGIDRTGNLVRLTSRTLVIEPEHSRLWTILGLSWVSRAGSQAVPRISHCVELARAEPWRTAGHWNAAFSRDTKVISCSGENGRPNGLRIEVLSISRRFAAHH